MLRFKNYTGKSAIHGTGVFTEQDLAPHDLVWSFEEEFDRRFSAEEFQALSPAIKEYYLEYGYRSVYDNFHYLPMDNDRFMNHCFVSNVYFKDGKFYAKAALKKGTELTCDYREFVADWALYEDIYTPPASMKRAG